MTHSKYVFTQLQRACAVTAHVCCDGVYPLLVFAFYFFVFFAVHEVLLPSGRLPYFPAVEVRLRSTVSTVSTVRY